MTIDNAVLKFLLTTPFKTATLTTMLKKNMLKRFTKAELEEELRSIETPEERLSFDLVIRKYNLARGRLQEQFKIIGRSCEKV